MRIHRLKKYSAIFVVLNVVLATLLLLDRTICRLAVSNYFRFLSPNESRDDDDIRVLCTSPPPNSSNAIAFLTSLGDFSKLAPRLTQLDARLADNCSSAILLFHTDFPFASDIAQITTATRRRVIFQNVDQYFASFPHGFNPYLNEPTFVKRGKWNYHQMIRFWFKSIFEINEIQSFKYIMRLDTDSRLVGKWFDLFKLMETRNLVYIANEQHLELERILPGTMNLKKLLIEYQNRTGLIPPDQRNVDAAFSKSSIRIYYNNFEVFQSDFFRQKKVRDWINAVDASYGIYKYRWGDAMLRYLTLALFADEHQIAHRTEFNLLYCHPC